MISNKLNALAIVLSCALVTACGGSESPRYDGEWVPVPAPPGSDDGDTGDEGQDGLTNVTNDDPELFAKVIADFEDMEAMKNPDNGWTLTGVFAEFDDWSGVTTRPEAARVGDAAVSTCEIGGNDCDSNTGSILTPAFTVESNYINFLMSGGATNVGLELRKAGTDTALVSYQPNSCDRPHITDNDDWFHLDVSTLQGEEVQLYLFDSEEGGCGFVSFDHFYESSTAVGTLAAAAAPALEATGVSIPIDATVGVISDFDDALQMTEAGWTADGNFAAPATADAWQGLSTAEGAARIGDRAFSSCGTGSAGCDEFMGTITSASFRVESSYLRFLAVGGSIDNHDAAINILRASTDEVLASFTPETCVEQRYITGDSDWYQFDVTDLVGQNVKLQVVDASNADCGFISVDHAYQTNSATIQTADGAEITPASAGVAEVPDEMKTYNVDVAADAFADGKVVGRFDVPQAMLDAGWTGTGVFAAPLTDDYWAGSTAVDAAARVGLRAVSTCEINDNAEGCDAPTGTLTSPITTVSDVYLYFLMGGGNGDAPVGMRILDSIGNTLLSYSPGSCGPSHIDGNDDWTYIDQSQIQNAMVHYQLFDEEPGGCGFVSFDHLYQSATAPDAEPVFASATNGGLVMPDSTQLQSLGFHASLPYADSNSNVIGRFDDAQAEIDNGWVATGGFASPAAAGAWQGSTSVPASARIGAGAVSSCELGGADCDSPTGTLTSPAFAVTAEQPILSLMLTGGNGGPNVGLEVRWVDDGSVLASSTPNACAPSHIDGNDDWVDIDLSAHVGKSVQVYLFDNEPGGCGFISFDHVHMSDGVPYQFN
jgi:hypothetical protein